MKPRTPPILRLASQSPPILWPAQPTDIMSAIGGMRATSKRVSIKCWNAIVGPQRTGPNGAGTNCGVCSNEQPRKCRFIDTTGRGSERAIGRSWQNWPILEKEQLREHPRISSSTAVTRADFSKITPAARRVPRCGSGQVGETLRRWYALFEARGRRWYGVSRHDRWAILGGQLIKPVRETRLPSGSGTVPCGNFTCPVTTWPRIAFSTIWMR